MFREYEYPKAFVTNIRDVFGAQGKDWLSHLPSLLTDLETNWGFSIVEPMPNLTYSFVAIVTLRSGKKAVLKVAPHCLRTAHEIAWFESNLAGAPNLIRADSARGAMVLERLTPGFPAKKLVQAGDDAAATRAVAQVIRTMKQKPPAGTPFKHVSCLAQSLNGLEGKVGGQLLDQAHRLFSELTANRNGDAVLHGDLHQDNVLWNNGAWLAIDPHGYIGPRAFEVGTMIRNPYDCFPKGDSLQKTIENRIRILKEELTFSFDEIQGWGFAYTLMAAGWSLEDHDEVPNAHVEIAEAIYEMKLR